jgi:hypothetical protein
MYLAGFIILVIIGLLAVVAVRDINRKGGSGD